jgi:outer membrane protein assembly factor BamB
MQRGVLIISVLLSIGAIAFMASRQPSVPNSSASEPANVVVAPTVPLNDPAFVVSAPEPGPATSESGPGEWLMEGSNPARDRRSPAPIAIPLTQSREIGIPGDQTENGSPPVIAQGMLLIETADHLRAFDLASGQQRWIYEERGSYISPAVAGDLVYIRAESANEGAVIALNLQTGKPVWDFKPNKLSSEANNYYGGHITSPVIVDGVVYIGAGKELYALDAKTGAERWIFAAQDYVTASASIGADQIYISDFRYVYAINLADGTLRWAIPVETAFSFSSVAASDLVLVTSGTKVLALGANDGAQRWQLDISGQTLIPAAADDRLAYVKSTETLYALDLATGKEVWRFHDTNFVSLPVLVGGQVFLISGLEANTTVHALERESGSSTWKQTVTKLATTAPIVAGRAIYVRTTDGRIVAFSS